MSDGGNWARNEIRAALADVDNSLSIPNPKPLPGRAKPVPVCVGDDAFGLTSYMMKAYPNTGLTEQKRVLNYRLSRCQKISENAFRILANRWRFFRGFILLPPDKATIVALVAHVITLHNFLRSSSEAGKVYILPGFADQQDWWSDSWTSPARQHTGHTSANFIGLLKITFMFPAQTMRE